MDVLTKIFNIALLTHSQIAKFGRTFPKGGIEMGQTFNIRNARPIITRCCKEFKYALKKENPDINFDFCDFLNDYGYAQISFEETKNFVTTFGDLLTIRVINQLDKKNSTFVQFESENFRFQTRIDELAQRLSAELSLPIGRDSAPILTNEDKIAQLEKTISNLQMANDTTAAKSESSKLTITALTTENTQLRNENSDLRKKLDALQQYKKDYDAAMAVLNDPVQI